MAGVGWGQLVLITDSQSSSCGCRTPGRSALPTGSGLWRNTRRFHVTFVGHGRSTAPARVLNRSSPVDTPIDLILGAIWTARSADSRTMGVSRFSGGPLVRCAGFRRHVAELDNLAQRRDCGHPQAANVPERFLGFGMEIYDLRVPVFAVFEKTEIEDWAKVTKSATTRIE